MLIVSFLFVKAQETSDITKLVNYAEPNYSADAKSIEHTAFTISYLDNHKHAEWVSYCLIGEELKSANVKRKDNFKVDPKYTACANDKDYAKSGYDRGHLFPAANACTGEIMDESFYYTNMSPQVPSFNRGIWKRMEAKVRDWAIEYDTIYVVTGALLADNLDYIGNNVSIPKYYYKVVLVNTVKCKQALAFFIGNGDIKSKKLENFAVSVNIIELITGLNFCKNLDEELQKLVESEVDIANWVW